jgi:hypothetical protein
VSVVAVASVTMGAGVSALSNDRLLFIAGLDSVRLIVFSVVAIAVGLSVFFLSSAIEHARACEPRDNDTVVVTVAVLLSTWFTLSIPLIITLLLATSTTYTRLPDVPGHERLVIATSSGWDEVRLSLYRDDGLFLDPIPTSLPLFEPGSDPVAAGAYTLTDRDGSLVLSLPGWSETLEFTP